MTHVLVTLAPALKMLAKVQLPEEVVAVPVVRMMVMTGLPKHGLQLEGRHSGIVHSWMA